MLVRVSAMNSGLVLLIFITLGVGGTNNTNQKLEIINKLYNILNEVPENLYNPTEQKIIQQGTILNFNLTSRIDERQKETEEECVKNNVTKLQGQKLFLHNFGFGWLIWIRNGLRKGIEIVQKFFSWLFYPKFKYLVERGYPVELHHVETEDGYILNLDRIPYGKKGRTTGDRPVVLVMHGLLSSSGNFFYRDSKFGTGYNLVDAGFDVWFGNARGNLYSRKHKHLNPADMNDKLKFFDFSWHEIAMRDMPAIIDYILATTKKKKLHYIGHSQGGTVFFVLNSMKPWYNEKFETAHLLSAAGYQREFPYKAVDIVAHNVDFLYKLMRELGLVEIVIHCSEFMRRSAQKLKNRYTLKSVFYELLHSGRDRKAANDVPGVSSLGQFAHYLQNIRNKEFCQWDYGPENVEVYGTPRPPNYNLNLITVKTTLYYSLRDQFVSAADTRAMARDMRNAKAILVKGTDFGHSAYLESKDTKYLITEQIIREIKRRP